MIEFRDVVQAGIYAALLLFFQWRTSTPKHTRQALERMAEESDRTRGKVDKITETVVRLDVMQEAMGKDISEIKHEVRRLQDAA